MSNKNLWHEELYNNLGQYFLIEKLLYQEKTKYQNLVFFKNKQFGKIMALDGVVQTTEYDEFIYHEMITHVPITTHGKVNDILIIGGGDGGVLREVVKYKEIKNIIMVEIDEKVIELCKKYLPFHNNGSFNDKRLKLVIEDAYEYVNNSKNKFDIIISDNTDPIGPGKKLFLDKFYRNCMLNLNKDGIFISQNGVYPIQNKKIIDNYYIFLKYFKYINYYQFCVPTYYGGNMMISCLSNSDIYKNISKHIIKKRIIKNKIKTIYYDENMHFSSFTLSKNIKKLLNKYKISFIKKENNKVG